MFGSTVLLAELVGGGEAAGDGGGHSALVRPSPADGAGRGQAGA